MTLVLSLRNAERLDNGERASLTLDRHGAVIGRAPYSDWCLPDPERVVSSRHCEIEFRNGRYLLNDCSTNGTFVNGAAERAGPAYELKDGDRLQVGPYEILAELPEQRTAPPAGQPADWKGWEPFGGAAPEPPPSPAAEWSGGASPWAAAIPQAPQEQASAWSSAVSPQAAPGAVDIWGQLSQKNEVDWARGFGGAGPGSDPFGLDRPVQPPTAEPPRDPFALGASPAPASAEPARDPFGLSAPPPAPAPARDPFGSPPPRSQAVPEVTRDPFGLSPPPPPRTAEPAREPLAQPPIPLGAASPAFPAPDRRGAPQGAAVATLEPPAPRPPPAPASGGDLAAFLSAAGLQPQDLQAAPNEVLSAAGSLLRRMAGGLIVMLEARARAKAQLGAQGTMLEFAGNNPLKFARSPAKALAQLINPPERGFMPAEDAVEDAFRDLQAHQMATLTAMQGALAATLARFAPSAIRDRAEMRGVLARIIPAARDATLWQAYEREFEGVVKGSDEAFMDVFAKEFREAYTKASAEMKAKR